MDSVHLNEAQHVKIIHAVTKNSTTEDCKRVPLWEKK